MLAPIVPIYRNPNGGVPTSPNNELREIKNTTAYWPKPYSFNHKDEEAILLQTDYV